MSSCSKIFWDGIICWTFWDGISCCAFVLGCFRDRPDVLSVCQRKKEVRCQVMNPEVRQR
ncbi:unnamed protein product, partial [Nesidiocoris tenuis]